MGRDALVTAPILTDGINSVKIESMNTEQRRDLEARAAVHAALADPARLLITDALTIVFGTAVVVTLYLCLDRLGQAARRTRELQGSR